MANHPDLTTVRAHASVLRDRHQPETADILESLADECERGRRVEALTMDLFGHSGFSLRAVVALWEELRK
jgi:hypothetical protein